MPNHVTSKLTLTGPAQQIYYFVGMHIVNHPPQEQKRWDGTTYIEPAYRSFDFNTVIPMPASLDGVEDSSRMKDAVEFLTGKSPEELQLAKNPKDRHALQALGFRDMFRKNDSPEKQAEDKRIREAQLRPEDIEMGHRAIAAIEECGHPTWYGWSIENWGTKWNSYDFEELESSPGRYEFKFDTAWSVPEPVLSELAKRYPDIKFEIVSFDEGWNFAARGWSEGGELFLDHLDANDELYEEVYGVPPEHDDEDEDEGSDDGKVIDADPPIKTRGVSLDDE